MASASHSASGIPGPARVQMLVVLLEATWEIAGERAAARKEIREYALWYAAWYARDVSKHSLDRLLNASDLAGRKEAILRAIALMKTDADFRRAVLCGMFRVYVAGDSLTADARGWIDSVAQEAGTSEMDYGRFVVRFIRLNASDSETKAYADLGLPPSASEADIRSRFNELAKEFHPDRHMSLPPAMRDLARREFDKLKQAYDRLTAARVLWGRRRGAAELTKAVANQEVDCFFCESANSLPDGTPATLAARCRHCRSLLVHSHELAEAILSDVTVREPVSAPPATEEPRQPPVAESQTEPPRRERPPPQTGTRPPNPHPVNWTALAWVSVFVIGSALAVLTVDAPKMQSARPPTQPTSPRRTSKGDTVAIPTAPPQPQTNPPAPIDATAWTPSPPTPVWPPQPREGDVKQKVDRLIAKKQFAKAVAEISNWIASNAQAAKSQPALWETMLLAKRDAWSDYQRNYSKKEAGGWLWLVRSIRAQGQACEELMTHCMENGYSNEKTRRYYLEAVNKAESAITTGSHLLVGANRTIERGLAYHQLGLVKHVYAKHTRNIRLLDEAIADYEEAATALKASVQGEPVAVAVHESLADARRDRSGMSHSGHKPDRHPAIRYAPQRGPVRQDDQLR